ncbi:MAG: hypothetical protein LBU62_01105 [Bacteroidales bacterium]|jgi:hypothetical protein|nr:hypothetical protein [Bacteroidales bacterium]
MTKFVRFFMFVALICVAFSCKDDEEKPTPLVKAYVEVAVADATQLLPGSSGTQTFTVESNRELEVSSDVGWCTVSVSGKTVTLTFTENSYVPGAKPAKRAGIVTVKAKAVNADDNVTDAKANVTVDQELFGLPKAELLDMVFNAQGAVDNSPLANPVYNVPKYSAALPVDPVQFQKGGAYGDRYTARFTGTHQDGDRGSCALRVDFADFKSHTTIGTYNGYGFTPPIPRNALGEALTGGSFSMEVLCRPETPPDEAGSLRSRYGIFDASQYAGPGIFIDGGQLRFNLPYQKADGVRASEAAVISHDITEVSADWGLDGASGNYQHVIATFDKETHTMRLYLNGVQVEEALTNADIASAYRVSNASGTPAGNPAEGTWAEHNLCQWICIGGVNRRSDAAYAGAPHINKDDANGAMRLFTGEIVLARIYNKALTATEAQFLYDYERPE